MFKNCVFQPSKTLLELIKTHLKILLVFNCIADFIGICKGGIDKRVLYVHFVFSTSTMQSTACICSVLLSKGKSFSGLCPLHNPPPTSLRFRQLSLYQIWAVLHAEQSLLFYKAGFHFPKSVPNQTFRLAASSAGRPIRTNLNGRSRIAL